MVKYILEDLFGFVESGFFLISYCPLSWLSVGCILLVLNVNNMFQYCVLHDLGHLVNCIVPIFQFTSRLCLTNQSYSRNMSVLFKSMTIISILFLCPLTSIFNSMNLVTSPFLVLFALKTLNDMSASFVLIHSFLTNCLSILVYIHLEFTSICSCNSFPVFVFTFACTFSSFFLLFHQYRIIYQL